MLKKISLAMILIIVAIMQLCCIQETQADSTIDVQNQIANIEQEISRLEKEQNHPLCLIWRRRRIEKEIAKLKQQRKILQEQLAKMNRFSVTLESLELSEVHGYYTGRTNSCPECNLVIYFHRPDGKPIEKFHLSGATKKEFARNHFRVYQDHNRLELRAGKWTEQMMSDIVLPYKRGDDGNKIPNKLFRDTEASFIVRYPFNRPWGIVGNCDKNPNSNRYIAPGFKYRVYLRITKR